MVVSQMNNKFKNTQDGALVSVKPINNKSKIGLTLALGFTLSAAFFIIATGQADAASLAKTFAPKGTGSVDHSAYDKLVRKYVKVGNDGYNRVNYKGLKSGGLSALRNYLKTLQGVDAKALKKGEAHAYWINLYNAKTLELVASKYPIKSIKKINLGGSFFGSGPWAKDILKVSGENLSLDEIEHKIIRPIFKTALSHYALNCASFSCPNLMNRAYTGANRFGLMKQSAVSYVNHPRGISVKNGKITASKIYKWYAGDFGGSKRLKKHWLKYAKPELAARIKDAKISSYAYDWSLNDAK
jgi:hypothetical protein